MKNHQIHPLMFLVVLSAGCVGENSRSPEVAPTDVSSNDGGSNRGGSKGGGSTCTANQALRCTGDTLVRCNGDGTAEVAESCSLKCDPIDLKCTDVVPSNNLANYLASASSRSNLNLGDVATIDTDTGVVTVDGVEVRVVSGVVAQSGGPELRVFAVRSLTTKAVTVTGKRPLAIVSTGDIVIAGEVSVSAKANVPGAGAYHDGDCVGTTSPDALDLGIPGNSGGGGFGTAGGAGGDGDNTSIGLGIQLGVAGGRPTGNASLVPLRGGCAGGAGRYSTDPGGAGGGAIQLSSRTRIVVTGTVAANGGGGHGGGGSGGGILLEAPFVDVSGTLVANGGSGHGCSAGSDGASSIAPAQGGDDCVDSSNDLAAEGRGGNGAAGTSQATAGHDGIWSEQLGKVGFGGAGGGGFGRIRINTAPGGARLTGVASPEASLGPLGSRSEPPPVHGPTGPAPDRQ